MLKINSAKTTKEIIEFLQKAFKKAGFSRAVIGLSGGLDSSVSCTLAVQALGKDNVFPFILPCGNLNKEDIKDALSLCKWLNIPKQNIAVINIKRLVDEIVSLDPKMDKIRKGNIIARTRMILIFDHAKKHHALVVGTENKSEYLLGYFTRYGDEASDIEPIRGLYKTQVKQLARYLGIPDFIINKIPSAGLWRGQTDEGELGFSYDEADRILYFFYEKKTTPGQCISAGCKKEAVEKVKIRIKRNKFKNNVPYIFKT